MEQELIANIQSVVKQLYGQEVDASILSLQKTKKEFEGDLTLVVFPLLKISHKKPEETAQEIGNKLKSDCPLVSDFNVIKGFLNLTLADKGFVDTLASIDSDEYFGFKKATETSPLIMVEYSSPNTNKPLHLGHIRNNLLGYSLSKILEANGNKVVKTNIVNDRGIHICKSMLAWQKFGAGATPESTSLKGDHLVGDYYVAFDKAYKVEVKQLMEEKSMLEDDAKRQAPLMLEAQEMLRKWEANDADVRNLWKTMNEWVYKGFDETYKRLGVSFDKIYYESETYLVGKDKVAEGLSKGIFVQKEDGSVWADLTADGLDQKLLLRADGTSVYMTQDIGTATLRFGDYKIDKMIYVVGNEQDYHFKVLSLLLDKLGFAWGKSLVHFSYGMVELPEGKMKSREGTVVDADDLMDEMITTASEISKELGKLEGLSPKEISDITTTIGLGALKYFILKVDPRKNMTFNPKESIDFNGNTGSFIQYTFARICSVLRKADEQSIVLDANMSRNLELSEKETSLVQSLSEYPAVIKQAGDEYSPSLIANYIYELVKQYNQFYHDCQIIKEEDFALRNFRLILSRNVAKVVKSGMGLLGISVPEKM
ncbi:MAG: Arginine--tRNA ligase [Bacteroidetes bacterium ADurb.Bin302]|nr:MAG: Arginine--tRNA ligase [Bacteroidetes bacterium ADurb.Bin302]